MVLVPAIGYVRSDVSGVAKRWHEQKMRHFARRLGYNLRKTVEFSRRTEDPITRLAATAALNQAEAVFVPSVDHFGGTVPRELVRVVDVITVEDEQTYARWPDGRVDDDVIG